MLVAWVLVLLLLLCLAVVPHPLTQVVLEFPDVPRSLSSLSKACPMSLLASLHVWPVMCLLWCVKCCVCVWLDVYSLPVWAFSLHDVLLQHAVVLVQPHLCWCVVLSCPVLLFLSQSCAWIVLSYLWCNFLRCALWLCLCCKLLLQCLWCCCAFLDPECCFSFPHLLLCFVWSICYLVLVLKRVRSRQVVLLGLDTVFLMV